mgnify:CR=1 FL=1
MIFTIDDFANVLDWIELIGPIYTFHIISLSGIITNILVILVIKSKKTKKIIEKAKENERMYNYLVINSTFNILECILSSFTLISECLGVESLFCSTIMDYPTTQYIKVYVLSYLGISFSSMCFITFYLILFSYL